MVCNPSSGWVSWRGNGRLSLIGCWRGRKRRGRRRAGRRVIGEAGRLVTKVGLGERKRGKGAFGVSGGGPGEGRWVLWSSFWPSRLPPRSASSLRGGELRYHYS